MTALYAAATVAALTLVGLLAGSVPAGAVAVTVVAPYAAFLILLTGVCYRVLLWAKSPVPFRIPTTCGQQRSLPWIRTSPIDNPSNGAMAAVRVAIEALTFRSLLYNSKAHVVDGRLAYAESRALWLAALVFHWSLLIIVLRHLRFMVEPVPSFVSTLIGLDGMLQIGAPPLLLTDVLCVVALGFLLIRRWWDPALRYISQFSDYFALLLLLAIVATGIIMRYATRADILSVKEFALGLATFHPKTPAAVNPMFQAHLLLVSALAVYFPFSKLMHFGGVFLSPTRNLANNSRRKRHINPWNQPVPTHTYREWESEYEDKLKLAGIPLDEAGHVE